MSEVQGKVWGSTRPFFLKNNVEMHRLDIRKGGYCSLHRHAQKFNLFYVAVGALKVSVHKTDYELVDTTYLGPSDVMVVPPGEFHRFEALSDVVAFEIYWTELDPGDIERKDVGGINLEQVD